MHLGWEQLSKRLILLYTYTYIYIYLFLSLLRQRTGTLGSSCVGLETLVPYKPFGLNSGIQQVKYGETRTGKYVVESPLIRPFFFHFPWERLPFSLQKGCSWRRYPGCVVPSPSGFTWSAAAQKSLVLLPDRQTTWRSNPSVGAAVALKVHLDVQQTSQGCS